MACSQGPVGCDGKRLEEMLVVGTWGSNKVSPADTGAGEERMLLSRIAQERGSFDCMCVWGGGGG